MNTPKLPLKFTRIETWFERDRQHVSLETDCSLLEDHTIVEWWDEDVTQAVEDGFLNPQDWHTSAYQYASERGLLPDVPACGEHWLRMNGEYGCLPDGMEVYEDQQAALDVAKDMFELGRTRLAMLKREHILPLNPTRDGASYVSVQACACRTPWDHFDGGEEEYLEQFAS